MKADYEREVCDAKKRIAELEAEHAKLEERRKHLDIGQLSESKRIRTEMDEIEGKLSDLKLLRDIAQEQLDKWQKGMAKAKPLLEDAAAAHERGREIFVKFAEYQKACRDLQKDLDKVNLTLSTKAKEFEDLTGESMGLTLSMVCYPASAFAAAQTIKPYDSWTYRSETELKEEDEKLKTERLKAHEQRIKLAEEHAPPCPQCETKMIVDRHSGHSDSPGQAGSGHSSHHWALICPTCGARQTIPIPETKVTGT